MSVLFIQVITRWSKRKMRWFCLSLAVLFCVALWVGGSQPFAVGLIPSPWDKLVHAASFGLLAAAIGYASGFKNWAMVLTAFAGAMLIGVADEWHQMFLPGRQAGWDDLAADLIGSALGALGLRLRQANDVVESIGD
jgi:VanZ like family